MRAAFYTRVSSDPNGRGRSVAEQEDDCRVVAEREGWEVVKVFTDSDRSASRYAKRGRPAYHQLAQFVAAGGCDVLVTWEASRFQRDLEDYVRLRELCRLHSVQWCYQGRVYDLSRTDDRLTTGLDALLAERESDLTRERVLRAVRANAVKGRPHGPIPYGYRREYDQTTGELVRQVIREDEAVIVREAARRFLAGEAPYSIAADLNNRGVPPARFGKWDLTRIRRLLTSPTNAAQRVHQGEIIGAADWEPILDLATWQRCVARFDDPSRTTTDQRAVKYLLSGIARCGVCGGKIKASAPRGYPSYQCSVGFCVARKIDSVDRLVIKAVIGRLDRPDALALLIPEPDTDTAALIDGIATKRARLESLYDDGAAGIISAQGVGHMEARLLADIASMERQLRRVDVPAVLYELVGHAAVKWDALHITQQREAISVLAQVTMLKTQRGARVLDPESIRLEWRRSPAAVLPAPH